MTGDVVPITRNVLKFTDTAIKHDSMINAYKNQHYQLTNTNMLINTYNFKPIYLSRSYQDYKRIVEGEDIALGKALINKRAGDKQYRCLIW